MSKDNNISQNDHAHKRERMFVFFRDFSLNGLALGTMITSWRIGQRAGEMVSQNENVILFIQLVFVSVTFIAIDQALKFFLSDAANVKWENEEKPKIIDNKIPTRRAIGFLVASLVLSIVATPFISKEITQTDDLREFNDRYYSMVSSDSLEKQKAFSALSTLDNTEKSKIETAKKSKAAQIKKASRNTTEDKWIEDYEKFKDKRDAWFWTCSKCSKRFKEYRSGILKAESDGDLEISNASNQFKEVRKSLTHTINYEVSKDSMLIAVNENVQRLEMEKHESRSLINWMLVVLNLIFGGSAFQTNSGLRDHRILYGQKVSDGNLRILISIIDIPQRLIETIIDLLHTVFVYPFDWLRDNGWFKTYEPTDNRINDAVLFVAAKEPEAMSTDNAINGTAPPPFKRSNPKRNG